MTKSGCEVEKQHHQTLYFKNCKDRMCLTNVIIRMISLCIHSNYYFAVHYLHGTSLAICLLIYTIYIKIA